MTGKQERKARPRINLEKEGKKRAFAETKSVWVLTMSGCCWFGCCYLSKFTEKHTHLTLMQALLFMKNMTGKQERKGRPKIILEKEGKKRASAETKSVWNLTMPRLARITPGAVPGICLGQALYIQGYE